MLSWFDVALWFEQDNHTRVNMLPILLVGWNLSILWSRLGDDNSNTIPRHQKIINFLGLVSVIMCVCRNTKGKLYIYIIFMYICLYTEIYKPKS